VSSAADAARAADRRAALREIVQLGDPVLRSRATEVERFDDELDRLSRRLGTLMERAGGVGLAAPQVGLLTRVLVYCAPHDPDRTVRTLVNPAIAWASDEQELFLEGCLSIPGLGLEVRRPSAVRVRYRDVRGQTYELEAEGDEASVVQHEIDHLDGVLILDRVDVAQRRQAIRALHHGEHDQEET
jgi:peptide deformylase